MCSNWGGEDSEKKNKADLAICMLEGRSSLLKMLGKCPHGHLLTSRTLFAQDSGKFSSGKDSGVWCLLTLPDANYLEPHLGMVEWVK